MSDDELFLAAAERHVQPASSSFFETFWREAEQRQRTAARRWRAAALALAVVAVAAVGAAGVMAASRGVRAGQLDRTWRCTPAAGPYSGRPTLGIHGSPRTPRLEPFFHLTSRQSANDSGSHLDTPALHFDTASPNVVTDTHLCKEARAGTIPFGSRGLAENNVYTSTFLGSFSGDCRTPPAILIRAHVTFARGGAAAARVIVVSASTQKPIAYFTWTPRRIAVWLSATCDVRAYPY